MTIFWTISHLHWQREPQLAYFKFLLLWGKLRAAEGVLKVLT